MTHTVFLALGTNLGDRPANLRAAIRALEPDVRVTGQSQVYETEPWGYLDQPAFLNMALQADTRLTPVKLLAHLKALEARLGRKASFRNGPRLIDLDILFYDELTLETDALVIPHPRLHERAFVLAPLAELAPGLVHPLLMRSISQLAAGLDQAGIRPVGPLGNV